MEIYASSTTAAIDGLPGRPFTDISLVVMSRAINVPGTKCFVKQNLYVYYFSAAYIAHHDV